MSDASLNQSQPQSIFSNSILGITSVNTTQSVCGSGFIINYNGQNFLATAGHVIQGSSGFVWAYLPNWRSGTLGQEQYCSNSFRYMYDASIDVGVIQVIDSLSNRKDFQQLPSIEWDTEYQTPGRDVIAVGMPQCIFAGTITRGVLSINTWDISDFDISNGKWFQHSAIIYQGNSGGPLLNVSGTQFKVIGINTHGVQDAASIVFALQAKYAVPAISSMVEEINSGLPQVTQNKSRMVLNRDEREILNIKPQCAFSLNNEIIIGYISNNKKIYLDDYEKLAQMKNLIETQKKLDLIKNNSSIYTYHYNSKNTFTLKEKSGNSLPLKIDSDFPITKHHYYKDSKITHINFKPIGSESEILRNIKDFKHVVVSLIKDDESFFMTLPTKALKY